MTQTDKDLLLTDWQAHRRSAIIFGIIMLMLAYFTL